MKLNPAGVEALVAIVEGGTFEAAARRLSITPSAVSQRVRALEGDVGQVLVLRDSPCRPTPAGEVVVRLGLQSRLLVAEATADLADSAGSVQVAVAVNADSLATWFGDVVEAVAARGDVVLRLMVDDQDHTAGLLRSGAALAAVTSDPEPVQGCRSEHLGVLRYRPAASPAFAERWSLGRGWDWAQMPMVVFNAKDRLQHEVLGLHGVEEPSVVHTVPTSADFRDAVRRGLGWGMLPEPQLTALRESGDLVRLGARTHHDVHLHWQRWRIDSPRLAALSDDVRRAARAHLRH